MTKPVRKRLCCLGEDCHVVFLTDREHRFCPACTEKRRRQPVYERSTAHVIPNRNVPHAI